MPFSWEQGEHVAVIGETGSGKTYLETQLVEYRDFVVVLKTKADDTKFGRDFVTVKKAASLDNPRYTKLVLRPDYYQQAFQGWHMLERVWHQGSWTCVIDELVRAERIGLTDQIERGLTQGRSLKISMVCGMQRPSRVTRYAISEARHVFSFLLEGRDAKILAEATSEAMERAVIGLRQFQFAYYHRPTRTVTLGNANDLAKIFQRKALDKPGETDERERHGIFRRVSLPRV